MENTPSFAEANTWILYSDQDLLLVNTPAGLLSIPDGYHPEFPHLAQALTPLVGKLWIVHRLDKETSGVMLLARSAEAHRVLNQAFRERALHKLYHCLSAPPPAWHAQDVDLPLRINSDRAHRTRVDMENGKPARTLINVLRRGESYALLACEPATGYTHQIRAHLYHLGLWILGDTLYRPKTVNWTDSRLSANRLMLHAFEISFAHPNTGAELSFRAPYPPDFAEKINSL